MKPTSNLITDQYTRRGYIRAEKGMHDALQFVYRPMLAEQVEDLDTLVERAGAKESVVLVATAIAAQLKEWSEVERVPEGSKAEPKQVPITIATVRQLPYPLLTRLRRIICGVVPTDEIPDSTDAELSDYAAALKAAADGKDPGLEQLRNDVKN